MQTQLLSKIRRYAKSAWRHRWRSLALAWVVCLGGWTAVYSLPDQYQASARVYADADAVLGQLLRGIAIDSSPSTQVELLHRTLLSRPNLERVIARTDLDQRVRSAADRETILEELARRIRITAQTRNLFTITYTDHDPRLARGVVQTVLNLFIEQSTGNDRQQMENARVFVNQQIAAYERQLREAERRRAEFRTRYMELLPDGPAGATGLEQARQRLRQLRGELEDTRQRRELTRRQLEATPAMVAPDALPGGGGGPAVETRMAEAERTLRDLQLRYTDQHPGVIAQRNLIAELRASGAGSAPARGGTTAPAAPPRAATANRANPLHEQLRLRLVDVDASIVSLERQIREEEVTVERLEAVLRGSPQVQAEFQSLDRDYHVIRRNYEELLERREAVQIAEDARRGAERVRLEVVDPPVVPPQPSGPKRTLFAAGVLLAGLGAGAGLAFLLVQLDGSFYTLRDLRGLGLPVLGVVSAADPAPGQRVAVVAFAGGLLLLLGAFGAVLAGGSTLASRLPGLVARMVA